MVREEYKQTEVGVIPEDWKVGCLQELCVKIQDGTHFSPKLGGNDFLYVTSKNIGVGKLDINSAEKISVVEHRKIFKRCDVRYGDILLTKDGANTGNAAFNHLTEDFSLLSSVAFLRFDSDSCVPTFFLQQILSSDGQNRLKDLMVGNAITRLTLGKIKGLKFSYPSMAEQQAIAKALSDVDGLIDGLMKLIVKKQDIKAATMQQLLTGKTRLPGFGEGKGYKQTELGVIPEDWEVVTYGSIFTFLHTANNSRADLSVEGDVNYVHYGDIHTKLNIRLDAKKTSLPSISFTKISRIDLIEDGDVLMVDVSEDYEGVGKSVEVLNIGDAKVISGLHTFLLRDKSKTFVDGYRGHLHLIKPVKRSMDRMATGLNVYSLSKSKVKNIYLPVPPKEEQKAIAEVLSDMDKELDYLQTRLDKTKSIKQGMMQELLTGKTRLI